MSAKERVGRLMDRGFDSLRHPAAFKLRADEAVEGGFDPLRGKKYVVLVTFRRNGEAVPSPVWFAVDADGKAYVRTPVLSGKVKRVRNDPRVLLAPSGFRGKPTGPAIQGRARVLPQDAWPHAENTLIGAYGMGRKMYEGVVGDPEGIATYVEIVPGGARHDPGGNADTR